MTTVRDLLGFIVNPPPGDGSLTAGSDQLSASVMIGCPIIADNATDNTATIQAAVDQAQALGGGEVKLIVASGTTGIALGRWVSKPHVVVRGPGSRVLTIKAPSGSADVVSGLNFATLTGKTKAAGDYLLGAPQSGVIGLTIDGGGTANYGYRVWGCGLILDDVVKQNSVQGGIWTEFTDVDNFLDPNQKLEGDFGVVKSTNNGGDGWTMRGPHDSRCRDYQSWNHPGWGITIDGISGNTGYNGGITFGYFNSFLNTAGDIQLLGIGYCDVKSGQCTGANVGTGIKTAATTGGSRFRCAVAGRTPGLDLNGTAHRFDITNATNNPGDVVKVNGCQKCYVSIGGGAGNNNIFNIVSEGGPNFFEGVLDVGAGKTFKTGAALNSQTTMIFTANGAGGQFSTVKLPSSTISSDTGYAPILPSSQKTLMAGGYGNLAYAASMTPDNTQGALLVITVTDANAMTINAPGIAMGQLTFEIFNNTAGAMGAITWNAIYELAGAFTNPAAGKRRTITFQYDGIYGKWIETGRVQADI